MKQIALVFGLVSSVSDSQTFVFGVIAIAEKLGVLEFVVARSFVCLDLETLHFVGA